MIKIISKSTLLTLIMVLSTTMVMANDWAGPVTICYSAPQIFVYSGPNYAIYAAHSAQITMPTGQSVIANFEANSQNGTNLYDVLNDGQSISFIGVGLLGSPDMKVKVTGTGWFKITEFYGNALGGGTSEERWIYVYQTPTNGELFTNFYLGSSSTCPGIYTSLILQRTGANYNKPMYSYKADVIEVNSSNQPIANGLNYSTGWVSPGPISPQYIRLRSATITPIPANTAVHTGLNLVAGKRYKVTLKAQTPCNDNPESSQYINIVACTPTASLAPNGVAVNDNGSTISSFCSARTDYPITLSNTLPNGAPAVTTVNIYLQQVTNATGTGLIGGEVQSPNQPLATSYNLKNSSQFLPFQSILALGSSQVKYFRVRAEVINALGTTTTSPTYFRISNNQFVSTAFDFKILSGSALDAGSSATDGRIETNVAASNARGYELGSLTCGILPNVNGIYSNYRVEILRRDNTIPGSVFSVIFDSGVQPAPISTYDFNGRLIQGSQTYFYTLSTADRTKYDFQCRLSALNDCGWVIYGKPFFITTLSSCAFCRPIDDESIIDAENADNKADFGDTRDIKFSLSPNPTDGVVFFDLSGTLPNTESHLELINLQGAVLSVQTIASDVNTGQIDLSLLPAGLYFYRLQHGTSLISGKIIKN